MRIMKQWQKDWSFAKEFYKQTPIPSLVISYDISEDHICYICYISGVAASLKNKADCRSEYVRCSKVKNLIKNKPIIQFA
jgi:hypothetical protein